MFSCNLPRRSQYSSEVIDSPQPFHSQCTSPLQSKNIVTMVDCLVLDRRAFRGWRTSLAIHCVSLILLSGSKVWKELSSPVMILCRKLIPSSWNLSKFPWQIWTLKAFCSSVRILGMNFELTCLRWRSFLRILWTVARGTPVLAEFSDGLMPVLLQLLVDFVNMQPATPTSWSSRLGTVTGFCCQIALTELLVPCSHSGLAQSRLPIHLLKIAPTLNGHSTLVTQELYDRSLL